MFDAGRKEQKEGRRERERRRDWRMGTAGKNVHVFFKNNVMIT